MRRRDQAANSVVPSLLIQVALVASGVLSARLLGPELRGHLAFALLLPGVVAVFVSLGMPNALAYFTARDRNAARILLVNSLKVAVPMVLIAELAHFALFVVLFAHEGEDVRAAALPTLLVAPALLMQMLAIAHLQGAGRYGAMNTLRVGPYILYAAAVAACYVLGARSLSIIIWSYAFAQIVIAVLSLGVMRGIVSNADSAGAGIPWRAILGFGARGFAVSLSPIESFRADQLLVGAAMPAAALGYYSVGTAFAVLPRLLTQSLGLIATAEVAGRPELQSRASARAYLVTGFLLVGAIVTVIELLLPSLIQALFGAVFQPGLAASRLLVVAAGVLGLRRLVTDLVRGLGRPGAESIAEIASWPVLVAGGVFVISSGPSSYGIELVAATMLAASSLSLLVALGYLARALNGRRGHNRSRQTA